MSLRSRRRRATTGRAGSGMMRTVRAASGRISARKRDGLRDHEMARCVRARVMPT